MEKIVEVISPEEKKKNLSEVFGHTPFTGFFLDKDKNKWYGSSKLDDHTIYYLLSGNEYNLMAILPDGTFCIVYSGNSKDLSEISITGLKYLTLQKMIFQEKND